MAVICFLKQKEEIEGALLSQATLGLESLETGEALVVPSPQGPFFLRAVLANRLGILKQFYISLLVSFSLKRSLTKRIGTPTKECQAVIWSKAVLLFLSFSINKGTG